MKYITIVFLAAIVSLLLHVTWAEAQSKSKTKLDQWIQAMASPNRDMRKSAAVDIANTRAQVIERLVVIIKPEKQKKYSPEIRMQASKTLGELRAAKAAESRVSSLRVGAYPGEMVAFSSMTSEVLITDLYEAIRSIAE